MAVRRLADFRWQITPLLIVRVSPRTGRFLLEWVPAAGPEGLMTRRLLVRAFALIDEGHPPLVALSMACTKIMGR